MRRLLFLFCSVLGVACGGSGSPTSSTPQPSPGGGGSTPQPTLPTVQDRSFTLSKLAIDSGVTPFEMTPPEATGRLDMRANGAYTLSFQIALHKFVWAETVTGTHTFSGNTLQMTPADNQKTAVVPFQQTLIIDNLSLAWQSETQVIIALPIRPGAWRSEDTLLLTYTRAQVVAKPINRLFETVGEKFNYLALLEALKNRATTQ